MRIQHGDTSLLICGAPSCAVTCVAGRQKGWWYGVLPEDEGKSREERHLCPAHADVDVEKYYAMIRRGLKEFGVHRQGMH